MSGSIKTRSHFSLEDVVEETHNSGKTWEPNPHGKRYDGKQKTVSEGHRRDPKTGHYLSGGPFYTVNTIRSFPTVPYKVFSTNGKEGVRCHVGTPLPGPTPLAEINSSYNSIRSEDTSDLDPVGATAISLCAPTNPYSNLGTTLAESHREGLPSLPGVPTWRGRTAIARAAGSEYLNAVFGWLPLVDEVQQVGKAATRASSILSQYRKDEGSDVRRRFDFPIETSTTSEDLGVWTASYEPAGGFNFSFAILPLAAQGRLTRTVTTTRRKWFSGAFTYSIPSSIDPLGKIPKYGAEADKLFGTTLTPDVLWELTPWSWAVDWFSNTGMVINNLTNMLELGLVMRYGFVMEEYIHSVTYTLSNPGLKGLNSVPPSSVITTAKVRSEANPFGFGVAWQGLSPAQLAITAALGITRLR